MNQAMHTPHDEVHTDDEARSLRYVYKGPENMTVPWDWTFAQWGVCIAAFVAQWVTIAILSLPIYTMSWSGLLAVTFTSLALFATSFAIAGPVTRRLLSPETGLMYHVRTLLAETGARRPTTGTVTRRRTITVYKPRKKTR